MDDTTTAIEELMSGSTSLRFAVASGLEPRRMYTAKETARYLGISASDINREVRAGRLVPFLPAGRTRNRKFDVLEVDRWIGTYGSTSPADSPS